jgi:predicted Rossmann fold flavoprotein
MESTIYDVIVIGGGPAGMMAAGRAAELGKSVLLLEKNSTLGKKLLITGGGRCNITNYKPEIESLVLSYKNKPKPLYSVFSQFGVEETIQFFKNHGLETKLEAEGRMFPVTEKAESVWEVLVENLKFHKVQVRSKSSVTNISVDESSKLIKVKLKEEELLAKSCVIATGGTSHPETGSTGDGFKWLKNLGHTIVENNFALVPISIKDNWVKTLAGLTLKDIKISIFQDGKKIESKSGKLLFTHFGISGPTVLNMSSKIGDLLQYGEVNLELDLLPELDYGALNIKLQNLFSGDINKKIKNTLNKLIPSALVKFILEFAKIDEDKANNSITKEERLNLVKQIKGVTLNVKGLLGSEKAIVSSGGVKIEEINFQTMESRIIPNLYIVGDLLNIDRPSGGYSLQICWATGFVAGSSC